MVGKGILGNGSFSGCQGNGIFQLSKPPTLAIWCEPFTVAMIITVFGSLNYDLVTISNRLPDAGESIIANKFERHHGGKGANQCLAAARLSSPDVKVRMIGRVGNDLFGQELMKSMEEESIDISGIQVIDRISTGVATIFVDEESAENRILVFPGANGTWNSIPPSLKASGTAEKQMLILQNEIPVKVVYQALEAAHKDGLITVYNPSPIDRSTPLEVYKNADYLILNTTEADSLLETLVADWKSIDNDKKRAIEGLSVLGKAFKDSSTKIVITLGKNGYVYSPDKEGQASKPPGPLVDTTGAGDTFLGAFAASIIEKPSDMAKALDRASKASAIAVTRAGAAESIPLLKELV